MKTMLFSLKNSLLFSLFFLSLLSGRNATIPAIGVTYTPLGHPPPDRVASAVQSLKFSAVRLPDADPAAVRAFSYSNVSLHLSVPNSLVSAFATNRSTAELWLYTNVVPFYPRARISTISVGNDVLGTTTADVTDVSELLPAIRNLHHCLRDLGISKISVSTTFSFVNVLNMMFPPSAAEFQEPVASVVIKPLLQFLEENNSSFLINLYPYTVYKLQPQIPIGYALFQEEPFNFRDDALTGVRYRNLFDEMVDAVVTAMTVVGHENIPVVVTETGWPSSGGAADPDASQVYAEMYIKGLIRHLKPGIGTPLRKEGVAETFIYELFDKDEKPGNETGQQQAHWGILYRNLTKKYHIDFSASDRIAGGAWPEMALGFLLAFVLVSTTTSCSFL